MKKIYASLFLLPVALASVNAQTFTDSMAYNFTGGIQTFTVPCGVTSVFIKAYGAQGGTGATGGNSSAGGAGGLGALSQGTLSVTPSQVINVFVGGQGGVPTGGFNGGGTGGSQNAAGGGGASDIRVNGTALTDRVLTAGGGGGGGRGGCDPAMGAGGAGGNGGLNGSNGVDVPTPFANPTGVAGGGQGGQGVNGGAAGIGCSGFLGSPGVAGTSGTGGSGGAGQTCCCFNSYSIPGGGGGGGGFMGGGGGGGGSAGTTGCSGNDKGGGGGGAGGSNDISGVVNGSMLSSSRTGDGMVMIYWNNANVGNAGPVFGPLAVCADAANGTYSITAVANAASYMWMVTGGVNITSGQGSTSINVSATSSGSVSVYAIGICGDTSNVASTFLVVNPLPVVVATSPQSFICAQDAAITLTGAPSGGTFSGPGMTGSSFDPDSALVGANSIVYMYTDSNGCSSADTLTITVGLCTGVVTSLTENGAVSVSPNPATENIMVTWAQNLTVNTIQVYDVNGRIVLSENAVSGNRKEFNVSSLPAGNYNVVVKGETGMKTLNFLKK